MAAITDQLKQNYYLFSQYLIRVQQKQMLDLGVIW